MNFSSDHVEPIKADHGTQPPPPTSSTFFVLSLFPPRVLAFIHPLSAPPSPTRTRESVLFLGCAPLPHVVQPVGHPLRPGAARAPPPSISSSFSCLVHSLTHSLTLWQLVGFFRVTRRCNLFGRGREAPAEVVDEASGGWVGGGTRATRGIYRGRIGGGGRGGGDAARMRARGGQEGAGFSLFCGSYLPARHCPTPLVSRYVVPVLCLALLLL